MKLPLKCCSSAMLRNIVRRGPFRTFLAITMYDLQNIFRPYESLHFSTGASSMEKILDARSEKYFCWN